MKCPYCEEEMIVDYTWWKSDLCWTPMEEKSRHIINHLTENEFLLAILNYLKGCKIKVFRCSKCEIEIINEKDL